MRPGKTARYALHAALEMALSADQPTTVVRVARRLGLPQTALAKVFQQLVRTGLAVGTRGIGGGYRLARPARQISVLDVLSAFEPPHPAGRCLLVERGDGACPRTAGCGLRQLFDEADELLRCTFASVTLATLARRTMAAPPPPAGAPWRIAPGSARMKPDDPIPKAPARGSTTEPPGPRSRRGSM